ncbi:MAG: sulfotransferase [Flavobacteriales bacterium]
MGFTRSWATLGEYLTSGHLADRWKGVFEGIDRFVLFMGYPRSGHSLLGSILDAHPEALLAHEQDILRYLKYGFGRERLLALLMRNSMRTAQKGRDWSGYSYRLPEQYQGTYRHLRVIGDKKGANSTRRLAQDPDLLHRLEEKVGLPLRIIHVIRDPLDNVSRMALWAMDEKKGQAPDKETLRASMDEYFFLADTIQKIRQKGWNTCFVDLQLENLLREPRRNLSVLQEKVGLGQEEEHLQAASGLLFDSPKRASEEVNWPEELERELQDRVKGYDFLKR